jgi:hypothetical protein
MAPLSTRWIALLKYRHFKSIVRLFGQGHDLQPL